MGKARGHQTSGCLLAGATEASSALDMRHVAHYSLWMIRSIRDRGLRRLFEQADPSGVNAEHVAQLRNILAALHAAPTVAHMDMPGFHLHALKGELKGFWAVTVRANWRVIFRFDGDVEDVDYVDYH